MQYLTTVKLKRGHQQAIVQGMIHIGPQQLYARLQREVDAAVSQDNLIFYEGVRQEPQEDPRSSNEEDIREFFRILLGLYPAMATAFAVSFQWDKITYPESAINADITFSELTQQLDRSEINGDILLQCFEAITNDELAKKLEQDGGLKLISDQLHQINSITVDFRNQVAVSKVREFADGRDMLIHFGERHVSGIVELLQREAWVVEETITINIVDYL
jgi:hypothetical protein